MTPTSNAVEKIRAGVAEALEAVLQIVKDKRRQQSGFLAAAKKDTPLWGAYNIGVGVCDDIEIKIVELAALSAAKELLDKPAVVDEQTLADFQRIVEGIREVADVTEYSADRNIARERVKVLDRISRALSTVTAAAPMKLNIDSEAFLARIDEDGDYECGVGSAAGVEGVVDYKGILVMRTERLLRESINDYFMLVNRGRGQVPELVELLKSLDNVDRAMFAAAFPVPASVEEVK